MTEKKGFQASLFKGNYQKILPNFKLGPFKAEPIQNRSTERLRPELVEGSRRSPKSKIQNWVTNRWFPICSTIFWLVIPVVGTQANSANTLPLAPHKQATTGVGEQVFIPRVNLLAQARRPVDTYTGFAGYPLPSGATVALSYGWHQSLTTGKPTFHSGIDLLANPGTPVLSVEDGTVAFAGLQGNYGNLVVVNHQGGRQTRYAHLESVSVTTRQKVKTGDTLGTVGSTGRRDTDKPHLHFEVRYNSPQGWVAQDPEPNLKAKPTANSSKS
jgi:murein DD-endopeptidase MepM/ murein hydrolase activator NlpD